MKIKSAEPFTQYYVEVEINSIIEYFRCDILGINWERLYGETWEPEFDSEILAELRDAFFKYIS